MEVAGTMTCLTFYLTFLCLIRFYKTRVPFSMDSIVPFFKLLLMTGSATFTPNLFPFPLNRSWLHKYLLFREDRKCNLYRREGYSRFGRRDRYSLFSGPDQDRLFSLRKR